MSEKTSRSTEPIRLFKSDFLEFFTHIRPIIVLIIWLPIMAFFIYRSLSSQTTFPLILPIGMLLGLFFWSFAEYILHRFIFHFPAKVGWQKRVTFLFHGIHHQQPRVKSRLVMPPVVSLPLAFIFFIFFHFVFSVIFLAPEWTAPVFAGFILGYIGYDMIHYGTHHFTVKRGYFRFIRQHHMHHHFQTPDLRYGVSSPLWDYIFGTMPKNEKV